MTTGIPVVFRKAGSSNLASYGATDIIEGVSYCKFYGGAIGGSAANTYKLSRSTFFCPTTAATGSAKTELRAASADLSDADFTKKIDLDFDTSVLNIPATLYGTMLTNIPIASYVAGASTTEAYAIVDLKKVSSGGTETSIVSVTSNTIAFDGTVNLTDSFFTTESTVPLTLIKKGEKIRITVEIWGRKTGGANVVTFYMLFDPESNSYTQHTLTSSAGYTSLTFNIPFKIDL